MFGEWPWAGICLALAALLAYHLRKRGNLYRWLERGDAPEPPRAWGAWDRLHALIHRSRRESARREAELVGAVSRWQEAARALPDGVVMLDGDRIEWCNDTARLHLEIDPASDAGTPINHLVRIPEFTEYLDGGDHARPLQVQPPNAEGRVLSLQVVPYGEGRRLVLSRDITQFQRVERMRREFVANVSHELRTPLTVISGFLETLRDETDPKAAERYRGLMTEQAQRMQRLVEDLLTLSSLESSPPPPMADAIDMKALPQRLDPEAPRRRARRHPLPL